MLLCSLKLRISDECFLCSFLDNLTRFATSELPFLPKERLLLRAEGSVRRIGVSRGGAEVESPLCSGQTECGFLRSGGFRRWGGAVFVFCPFSSCSLTFVGHGNWDIKIQQVSWQTRV